MPRTANGTSVGVHRPELLKAMSAFMVPAVFAALDRADKRFDTDPAVAQERSRLEARKKELQGAS